MTPEQRVQQAAKTLEQIESGDEIDRLLVDLEFVYQALEPGMQELATSLIDRLNERRRSLPGSG